VQRHPFDPVSAVFGVLAVALGILVATRSLGGFDTAGGWWLAAAAAVVGVALIPWNLRGAGAAADEHEDAVVEGEGPALPVGADADLGEDAGDPRR
jgi:hypothetical protein